jgi:hypothetical protein
MRIGLAPDESRPKGEGMSMYEGRGIGTYLQCLQAARHNGEVGVHIHLRQPQAPESRLGFRGKRLTKKSRKEIKKQIIAKASAGDNSLLALAVRLMREE